MNIGNAQGMLSGWYMEGFFGKSNLNTICMDVNSEHLECKMCSISSIYKTCPFIEGTVKAAFMISKIKMQNKLRLCKWNAYLLLTSFFSPGYLQI